LPNILHSIVLVGVLSVLMKILLIGEYSRLHNSLKEGLEKLGHQVCIAGFSDGFKNYPVDIKFTKKWATGLRHKLKVAVFKITGFNITSWYTYKYFFQNSSSFSGYDAVQLISENSFYCEPWLEKKMLQFIFNHNKKVFLLSCGDDYSSINYYFNHPEEKSVVQPYFQGKIKKKQFQNVLKFRKESYRKLHEFILDHVHGVIASDLDYHVPLANKSKYLGMIPNPINVDLIYCKPITIQDKIIIFLGINNESYFKKGIDYFEKALELLPPAVQKKVTILRTCNKPYAEYINLFDEAHILLDQAFARDQGYNALEAMAKGKVVFTGAESIFKDHYQLQQPVAVNAIPDAEEISRQLVALIENPEELLKIGKNARAFVSQQHHYVTVAQRYLEAWQH
jgi:glycosyltransferase involved in cell wall biosynthesis